MPTQFVLIYHPALSNVQVSVPVDAIEVWEERGWLLVDPGGTSPPPIEPYLTQAAGDSRYLRVSGGVIPDQYLPTRLSDAGLKAAYVAADPVLSNFTYDGATGNLLSYQENGVTITMTYNSDGTVATSKRGTNATKTYSYSGGNLVGVA